MPPTMYPYLSYRDAATTLSFLQEAFEFSVGIRWDDPEGTAQHAEATFGEGAVIMGTGEHPSASLEGSSVGQGIYVYVDDVDAHFERARVVVPGWFTRRRTRRGAHAATGRWTPRGTSGGSETTDRTRRAVRKHPRSLCLVKPAAQDMAGSPSRPTPHPRLSAVP